MHFLKKWFRPKESAWEKALGVIDQYKPLLYRRCYRILKNPVWIEDAMQEIAWVICRSYPQYQGDLERILPWLYRITTTQCLKILEKEGAIASSWESLDTLEDFEPFLSPEDLDAKSTLKQILDSLSPSERSVVLYYYESGMTQDEISQVMEVSRNQVRSWLTSVSKKSQRVLLNGSSHPPTQEDFR